MTRHGATVCRPAIVGACLLAFAAAAAGGCPPTAHAVATTTIPAPAATVLTDPPEGRMAVSPAWSRAQGALVTLLVASGSQMSAGTGIVLTAEGVGLTNAHVVRGARRVRAHDVGTGRDYPAIVLGSDPVHDIAVIRLGGATGLPVAQVGDSDTVRVGDRVAAIGNVGGVGAVTLAEGVITSLRRRVDSRDANGGNVEHLRGMIETDAWVRPGDSGGALVDAAGRVIGVTTSSDARYGYAIPIRAALAAAHRLAQFDIPYVEPRPELAAHRRGLGDDQAHRRGLLATDLKVGARAGHRARNQRHKPGRGLLSHRDGRGLLR